jgi:hypothetical protein
MEIDKRLMTFDDYSFREYLAKPIIIFSKKAMSDFKEMNEAFKKMGDDDLIPEGGNSFLVFAYIDRDAGITFDVLGFCNFEEDNVDIVAPLNQIIIFRKEALADSSFTFPPEDLNLECFDKHIKDIIAFYHGNDPSKLKNLNEIRNCVKIDKFRHSDFPDDILVHLVKENNHPHGDIKKYSFELIWLRTERIKDGFIQGTFLEEPFDTYDIDYDGNLVNVQLFGDVAYVDTKIPQEEYELIFNSNKK